MSETTNITVLVSTSSLEMDRRIVLGNDINSEYFNLLTILTKYSTFCLAQHNAGVAIYKDKLKVVNDKLNTLKERCNLICNIKDKIIVN